MSGVPTDRRGSIIDDLSAESTRAPRAAFSELTSTTSSELLVALEAFSTNRGRGRARGRWRRAGSGAGVDANFAALQARARGEGNRRRTIPINNARTNHDYADSNSAKHAESDRAMPAINQADAHPDAGTEASLATRCASSRSWRLLVAVHPANGRAARAEVSTRSEISSAADDQQASRRQRQTAARPRLCGSPLHGRRRFWCGTIPGRSLSTGNESRR